MCKANLNMLLTYIHCYLNQPKCLSEWKQILNQKHTKMRKLTDRELAFAFRVIEKKRMLMVNRSNRIYCFSIYSAPVPSIVCSQGRIA